MQEMGFTMEVMPGLPPYGEPALSFSQSKSRLGSEHFVVKFRPNGMSTWVGNFAEGLTDFSVARLHPDGHHALIISGGMAYIVNPYSRELVDTFGVAIEHIFEYAPLNTVIINHQSLRFEAIGAEGQLWLSRRISLDGFRNVQIRENILSGEAWYVDDTWYPFQLDLNTGQVIGGSYPD